MSPDQCWVLAFLRNPGLCVWWPQTPTTDPGPSDTVVSLHIFHADLFIPCLFILFLLSSCLLCSFNYWPISAWTCFFSLPFTGIWGKRELLSSESCFSLDPSVLDTVEYQSLHTFWLLVFLFTIHHIIGYSSEKQKNKKQCGMSKKNPDTLQT